MKKFTKILLGSILSVAMVVTGGLAFLNNNDAYAKVSINVAGHGIVSTTSDGATIETGTYAQPNTGTLNSDVVVKDHKEFSGIKLTGKQGSTFNLGVIDIAKSDWAGTQSTMASTREEVVEGKTITHTNKSFIEFVYQPSKMGSSNWVSEMNELQFKFTEVGNPSNYILIDIVHYDDTASASWREIQIRARGANQDKVGCYRYGKPSFQTGARKGSIPANYASILGYPAKKQVVTAVGAQTATVSLFYDNYANAVYSPVVSEAAGAQADLSKSFLIRDFDSSDPAENGTTNLWNGFKADANGQKLVNVTAIFDTTRNQQSTSIVVTKLGDCEFSSNVGIHKGDVKSAVINGGEVKYGTHYNVSNGKEVEGIKLTGTQGTKFNLGTINLKNTWFDDNWAYKKGIKHPVIKDTTTTYNKISGAFFNGGDASLGAQNALARSFLSFKFDPVGTGKDLELSNFEVTIREVDDPNTEADETVNFITYVIKSYPTDVGYRGELEIVCKATNNPTALAERFYQNGIGCTATVRRQFGYSSSKAGWHENPVGLYYDVSQNSAYTDVAYAGTSGDGIYGAFKIRDFNASKPDDNSGNYDPTKWTSSSVKNNNEPWSGFSKKEDTEVTVEVAFNSMLSGVSETSIIITSLGGYTFGNQQLKIDETATVIQNDTVNLNSFAGYKTSSITFAYENGPIAGYSIKVGEKDAETTTNPEYNFTEDAIVTFYDSNNNPLGTTNVTVEKINFTTPTITNGYYEVWRDNEMQTISESNPIALGDVIRLIPHNREHSELPLTDLRAFTLNGSEYPYNTNLIDNYKYLPLDWNSAGYYTLEVNKDIVYNSNISIQATFDRYCKITVIDDYIGSTDFYAWTMTDTFNLASSSGGVFGNTSVQTGKSNGEKSLVAYARLDLGEKYVENGEKHEGENEFARTDGFSYDVSGKGQLYYSGASFGDFTHPNIKGGDDQVKKAYTIVPDMVFETIYIGFNVRTEIKLEDDGNDGVDTNFSGLRFVVEVNKKDWNRYKFYSKETYGNNSATAFYNYITTKSTLDKVGVTDYASIGTKWMSPGWAPTLGKVNGLGLTCISKNGEKYDGKKVEGAKGGFIFYGLSETTIENGDMWLDNSKLGYSDDYYTYALTIRDFKDTKQTYVLSVLCGASYLLGGNTGLIEIPLEANLKTVCQKKYDNVVKAGADKYDDINRFKVYIDGAEKYYSLSYKHLQWLNEKGGLGHTIKESSTNGEA